MNNSRSSVREHLPLSVESLEPRMMLSTVQIFAAGSENTEVMNLQVDGQTVQSWSDIGGDAFAGQFETFTWSTAENISADQVRIQFANDVFDPANGIDTNLRVDAIVIDGVRYETEASNVFSTGTWKAADGIAPGNRESEFLHGGGYFQFSGNSNETTPITINARGDEGTESFALQINGQTVRTWDNINTVFSSYNYTAAGDVTADEIRIVFLNDQWDPANGIDTNLIVDDIVVGGVQYETESASVFSTGTWLDGNIVDGFGRGDTLHGSGYFQFSNAANELPVLDFQTDNFIVNEANGSAVLTVVRSGDLSQASSVDFEVVGGFALPVGDYTEVSGTIEFDAGEQTKRFTVPITNDNTPEGQETFTVAIASPTGASLGQLSTTIVTIQDDDNVGDPEPTAIRPEFNFTSNRVGGVDGFDGPAGLEIMPDGRVLVVSKFGEVFVVENGIRNTTPFLDIKDRVRSIGISQGLTGLALDPDFESNGHIYVLYTATENGVHFGRVSRFTVSASDANVVDPASEKILIGSTVANGFPDGGDIHLVGDVEFGNDGTLLISYGDAAGNGTTDARMFNSQNLDNLGGAIVRVDPETGLGLASNPFFNGDPNANRSKIWAYGLRNPYRFEVADDGSANPADGNPGTLYIGDVQRGRNEELNVSRGGENFGWPYFEGSDTLRTGNPGIDAVFPQVEFDRADATSIIAGTIYRGGDFPNKYDGRFFAGDWTRGFIWSYQIDSDGNLTDQELFATGAQYVTDMAYDAVSGNIYLTALNNIDFRGELYVLTTDPNNREIDVVNGDLEATNHVNGGYSTGAAGWVFSELGSASGDWQPRDSVHFADGEVEGDNVGFLNSGIASNTLAEQYDDGRTYIVDIEVGTRFNQSPANYSVTLYAGNTVLATKSGTAIGDGTLKTVSLVADDARPELNGQNLRLEVRRINGGQVNFDNLRVISQLPSERPVAINNGNLEATNHSVGGFSAGAAGWVFSTPSISGGGDWQPGGNFAAGEVEGENVGYLNSGSASNTLGEGYDSHRAYTLSVDLGARFNQGQSNYAVTLFAGSTAIATTTGSVTGNGQLTTVSVTADDYRPDLDGQALRIEVSRVSGRQLNFDNVSMTSQNLLAEIVNGDLETTGHFEGGFSAGAANWEFSNPDSTDSGDWNPRAENFLDGEVEGNNVGFLNNGSASNTFLDRYDSSRSYALNVEVGARIGQPSTGYEVVLFAGETVLASTTGTVSGNGRLNAVTLSPNVVLPNQDGDALRVEIRKTSGVQLNFDNVYLVAR